MNRYEGFEPSTLFNDDVHSAAPPRLERESQDPKSRALAIVL